MNNNKTINLVFVLLFLFIGRISLSAQQQNPIDSLRNLINLNQENNRQNVKWLLNIGNLYYSLDQIDSLKEIKKEAGILVKKTNDKCLQLNLRFLEAKYLKAIEKYTESEEKSKLLLQLSKENNCTSSEVEILLHLAILNLDTTNKESCLKYIQLAKIKANEMRDSIMITRANNMMGLYYFIN